MFRHSCNFPYYFDDNDCENNGYGGYGRDRGCPGSFEPYNCCQDVYKRQGCDLFTDEIARGGEIIVPRVVINMFGVLPGDFYSSIGGTGVGDEDFIRKLYGRC